MTRALQLRPAPTSTEPHGGEARRDEAHGDEVRSGDALLSVVEVFGPTYQGEGPSRGQIATFVRVGGCNLHCRWADSGCDSAYTWDASRYNLREEITQYRVQDIIEFIRVAAAPILVLTGGEPLLTQHRPATRQLLQAAHESGLRVEVETNGTQVPARDLPGTPHFNVSPKLANSTADPVDRRLVPTALTAFAALAHQQRAIFKFVVTSGHDLDEVAELVDTFDIPRAAVWIMPEGVDAESVITRARAIADLVLARGWNLTLRDHLTLWPTETRGR